MKDNLGRTPLMIACSNEDLKAVKKLVEAGANLEVEDNDGRTVLFYAYVVGAIDIVRYLKGKGAKGDIDMKDNSGRTLLMVTCLNKNLEAVKKLLEAGAIVTLECIENISGNPRLKKYLEMMYDFANTPFSNRINFIKEKNSVKDLNREDFEFLVKYALKRFFEEIGNVDIDKKQESLKEDFIFGKDIAKIYVLGIDKSKGIDIEKISGVSTSGGLFKFINRFAKKEKLELNKFFDEEQEPQVFVKKLLFEKENNKLIDTKIKFRD